MVNQLITGFSEGLLSWFNYSSKLQHEWLLLASCTQLRNLTKNKPDSYLLNLEMAAFIDLESGEYFSNISALGRLQIFTI